MASASQSSLKTAYFLGAGASAGATETPVLTQTLLEIALQDSRVTSVTQPADRELAQSFVRFLSTSSEWPAIDDVLALIDVALSENVALSTHWSRERLLSVRDSFHALIYACIQETVVPARAGLSDSSTSPLARLVNPERQPLPTVVTLNWDCLVERRFSAACQQRDNVIDYGVESVTPRGQVRPHYADALLVLKPHGSLSWGYCTFCSLLVTDQTSPFNFSMGRPCPTCNQGLKAVLVPPVASQQTWPPFLPMLWKKIEDELLRCDRIVFIGYSLPPQDVHVRVHLIRAFARRAKLRPHDPLNVEVVVKKDADRPHVVEIDKQRYRTILGGLLPSDHLEFFDNGLASWLEARK